jgi:2-oxoglutarate ferredoxin oxidoreductase subunit alpha
MSSSGKGNVAIVVAGQAGQGIQTIESILTMVLKRSGYQVFATKEYMSRIRGGSNSVLIRVGYETAPANVDHIDLLVPFDNDAIDHLASRISPETIIIGERKNLHTLNEIVDISFSSIAEKSGGKIYANTVAIATLSGILDAEFSVLEEYLSHRFEPKGKTIVSGNLEAARQGFEAGCTLRSSGIITFKLQKNPETVHDILIKGGEAVALGAISGGCNFISSYPMSPSTAVLTYMAHHDNRFGIVVEQSEDEIAAVNMAIGAWYAGARAMVTTSGGGFALMEEGISLAGVSESPLVVHIGQRPGPGTGLATRTEQADLELALYSGHGEFPRIIYAPGRVEEAFKLTHRAFDMADRYQVPVFVLTDQYFIDSYFCVPDLDNGTVEAENHTVPTLTDYKRYAFTEDGISPRGIPGFGEGLVCADSHEHDEEGHITEDIQLRNRMMEKRMGKMDLILRDTVPPTLIGPEKYRVLVICWGSNYHIVAEAVALLRKDDIAVLHFSQTFPLPPETADLLLKAETTILVENNYTGQFDRVLKTWAGVDVHHHIRKYDGRPFCSGALAKKILRLARPIEGDRE